MTDFEKEMLQKIDAGESLSEHDIRRLVYDFEDRGAREYGDDGRWTRSVTSIIVLNDRYFAVDWEQGLTELQENEFWNQPYEVEKKTFQKTIIVTEWIKKNK